MDQDKLISVGVAKIVIGLVLVISAIIVGNFMGNKKIALPLGITGAIIGVLLIYSGVKNMPERPRLV